MKDEIIKLTQELVKAPSTQGQSINAAQIYYDFLEEYGLNPTLKEYKEGEANVYAKIGSKHKDQLLISGHLDTVPIGNKEEWTHDPYSGEIIDGELWGRGSVDMKGGTATLAGVMVDLLKHEDDLQQAVFLAATAEEETGLKGAEQYVTDNLVDGTTHVIIAEPTDLVPKVREKGIIWFDISAKGKQAHASRTELGHNAIEAMAALIPKLHAVIPELTTPDLGRTSLNTGMIEGGSAANVVAQHAKARFDSRTTPGINNDDVIAALREVVHAESGDVQFTMEILENQPSILSPDDSFATSLAQHTGNYTGVVPELGGVHYATDGAVFIGRTGHTTPFVIYGPGSTELLHQTNERLDVSQLDIARKVYVATILDTITG